MRKARDLIQVAKEAQQSKPRATWRLQEQQNLLTPFCEEDSGSANKGSDKNNNKNILSVFPPAFFFFFLDGEAYYITVLSECVCVCVLSMWNIPLLKLQAGSRPRTLRTHRRH